MLILNIDSIEQETEAAYLVKCGSQTAWLPKSQCGEEIIDSRGAVEGLEIPQWLAEEKELEGFCDD